MKLSADQVKKIAHLARIDLSLTEVSKFQEELSEVIDYNASKLSQIKKTPERTLPASQRFGQEDEPRPSLPSEEALANAPQSENGLFVVPKVLEE